jgi:hypothetical protein
MTREEFKILAKGMKAVYAQPTFLPDADAFNIWYSLLQDIEYMVAQAAIQMYMLTNKFPPTIADIRECAASVSVGEKPLWSDGWEEVLMAIRKFGSYRETEALNNMTETTRMAVQRLGFRNICMSENIMADRANFRMVFEQIAEREHTAQQIPVKLSNLIESIQKKENENKRLLETGKA